MNDIHITRKVWICRFWILKFNFDYLFSSWSNQQFCEGTIHVIVSFYWSCQILSFSYHCVYSVCEPIWMIFMSSEMYDSVCFSHFTKIAKKMVFWRWFYLWHLWTNLDDIEIITKVRSCRWILKASSRYLFSSWSNRSFCEGMVYVNIHFYNKWKNLIFKLFCLWCLWTDLDNILMSSER